MGTALQTQNPRVSDVLASILHEAPVGLYRARSRRWTNRMRERERDIARRGKDGERNTWIWLWGSVQVLRSSIVFALIVRGCSSSALDTFHDGTHGS